MVWWCPSVRPSDSPSGSPSARFPHFSHTCWLLPGTWSHLWFTGVHECPPWCSIVGATVTMHQFFCILHWHIELKFYTWLCLNVLQIKFECRQFPSIFVGVKLLLECKRLRIHSFPHFSLTRFYTYMLCWHFACDFALLYYRSSSSFVNLGQCLKELFPFWNLEY